MLHQLNLEFDEELKPRPTTRYIILHHSEVASSHTVEDIHQWHKNKGWAGIGYHYFLDKEGEVYAKDIDCDVDIEILNPDQLICTLAEGGSINMEMTISNGRGYNRAEENKVLYNVDISNLPKEVKYDVPKIYQPCRRSDLCKALSFRQGTGTILNQTHRTCPIGERNPNEKDTGCISPGIALFLHELPAF